MAVLARATASWVSPTPGRPHQQDVGGLGYEGQARFSTKVHVTVDVLGNPLRFILTGGQKHDITQAEGFITDYAREYVIADKGYDSQGFREYILDQGMSPVIPPRSNRKELQAYDA